MTAVDTLPSRPDEPMSEAVDSVLEGIARAMDMYELERAWVDPVAGSGAAEDRRRRDRLP